MESEDKHKPHPAGYEQHGGQGHVCHRCGWVFPNPHPSAKHRRAHKKHCGRIDGFKRIDDTSDAAARVSDDDLSDGDHRRRPDLDESSRPAADKTLEPYNQLHANKIQGLDVQGVADQLETGTQLENSALFCSTAVDSTAEHDETSACTHSKELLLDCSIEKTGDSSTQNVVATSMIVDFTDVGDSAETNAVMDVPTMSILHGDLAPNAMEKDLKSHKLDEYTETDIRSVVTNAGGTEAKDIHDEASVKMKALDSEASLRQGEQMDAAGQDSQDELFSCTEAIDIPDEASVKMKALDSKASCAKGKQMDAAGQDFQNKLFSCTGPCPVETNAGENLAASSDAAQIENFTDMVDNCIVKDNVKENLTTMSVLSDISMGEISEMEHGLCKDYEPTELNLSIIYAGVEAGKEPDHLGGTALQSEIIPKKLDQSADTIPSSMQLLHKETGNRTNIDGLNDYLKVDYGHDNAEGSPFVEDVECEADISIAKFNVLDCLESDGMKHHPHTTNRESSGAQAIALLEPVSSPCEIDVAPVQLEVERECPFERQYTCHNSLNEVMPENHVQVADGDCVVCDAISQASEATKIHGYQHLICEESGFTNNDVVLCCRQETFKADSCQPDTKVESEPRSHASESELTYDENEGRNELKRFEQLTASTLYGSVLGPEGMDIDSGHLEKSGPYSDELNLQNVLEERTIEPSVGNDTDHHVTQTEVWTEHIERETGITKQSLEKLDHQKMQTENLQNTSGLYLDELDHQKDLQGTSIEPSVVDNTNHPVTHTGVQAKHIERESSPDEQTHEEPRLNESNEVGLCHHDARNFRLQEHTTPLEASALISVTLDNSNTDDISEVAPSGTCDQSLQEGGDRIACRQHSDAASVVLNASRDSNSQTDNVEGQRGAVSDGEVPSSSGSLELNTEAIPAISDQALKDQHASNSATEVENDTNNMDLFEAPSLTTLVEPAMQEDKMYLFEAPSLTTLVEPAMKEASNEIQLMQNPRQPSSSPKKKNVEIIEKVVEWESGKPHTPLKTLLAEAGIDRKQKETKAHHHSAWLPAKKDWGSKMVSEHPSWSSSNRADHKEWNSPARLPVMKDGKRKAKRKSTWVPFMCCSNDY